MSSSLTVQQHTAFSVAFGVGIASGILWFIHKKWKRQISIPTEWEEVGTLSQLIIYPIKSAKGIKVQTASATKDGLTIGNLIDRSFMVYTEDCNMVTGRECFSLVTLNTSFKGDVLTITDSVGSSVDVNVLEVDKKGLLVKMKIRGDDVQGIDCGDKVAQYLSRILFQDGKKVRLLYVGLKKFSRKTRSFPFFKFPTIQQGDTTLFNDSSSYNIATEASLEDLNSRLEKPITLDFFRPPIVIKGTKPFEEDDWLFIKIGNQTILRLAKPCERCLLSQIDPNTGKKNPAHIEELKKYRTVVYPEVLAKQWETRPMFSINCGIEATGDIKVGDKVFVSRYKPYWHVNKSK